MYKAWCNVWKKPIEHRNIGGVPIRSRNGVLSRKGRVIDGQKNKASNKWATLPPYRMRCGPPEPLASLKLFAPPRQFDPFDLRPTRSNMSKAVGILAPSLGKYVLHVDPPFCQKLVHVSQPNYSDLDYPTLPYPRHRRIFVAKDFCVRCSAKRICHSLTQTKT